MNNAKFKEILDSLPEKPPRSRLEPYRVLIEKLRRRGRTYREIVVILAEQYSLHVSLSTLHDFIRGQSREHLRRKRSKLTVVATTHGTAMTKPESPTPSDVQERILALKRRCGTTVEPTQKLFDYNPEEPLHLPSDTRNKDLRE